MKLKEKGSIRKISSASGDSVFLTIQPGENFNDLPETYVIFITENDVIGMGEPLYMIERRIVNIDKPFNDGSHIIYVNGAEKNAATELGKLMHDFSCTSADDMYYRELADKVRYYKGIVNVLQGSVSDMPFYDETFDIVTGFETIYFWPDFINDLKEVNRVLKKGGMVFFCNEAVYREGKMEKYEDLIELLDMKIYSEEVLKEALEKTGFKDFKAYIQDENDWICVTAIKI